jgi:predicted phage terminase large subunit-like protein
MIHKEQPTQDEHKEQLKIELQRKLYQQSFWEFCKDAAAVLEPSTDWNWNWHHRYIAEKLQAEAKRIVNKKPKKKDLIINVPFRSSKSMMISIIFPLWFWTQKQDGQFINLSYSESLALDHSSKCQILMESEWFQTHFPHIKLMKGFQSKGDFRLETGGARFSTGFLGSVLGKGADIIIMDDPNKPNANSSQELEQAIKNYNETIYSRLNDPKTGLRIIVQQRLHTKDLTGYLLENFRRDYEHICFPAQLTEDLSPKELKQFYINDLLWNHRFDLNQLNTYKRSLGSNQYAAQLLQRPVSIGGSILKEEWFKTISLMDFNTMLENDGSIPEYQLIIDPAFTANQQTNDPTAIMVCMNYKNHLYIREVLQVWLEFGDLIRKINTVADTYKTKKLYIEPKGSGVSIFQALKEQTLLNVIKLPAPTDSKITRVHSISPTIEAGRVILIDDSQLWVQNFIMECITFPRAKNDDMIDCLGYAVQNVLHKTHKLNYSFL